MFGNASQESSQGATVAHKEAVSSMQPSPRPPANHAQATSAAPRAPLSRQITADHRCRPQRRNKLFQKRTAAQEEDLRPRASPHCPPWGLGQPSPTTPLAEPKKPAGLGRVCEIV
jgi:hypothetical protein